MVHFNDAEASQLAERIRREGFEAEPCFPRGTPGLRGVRANPPDVVAIDLNQMPSYGRAMATLLRESKSTRMIPLVFLGGDPQKVAKVRALLPDAVYTGWAALAGALRRAIRQAPSHPVVPRPQHLPPAGKLHIREGSVVALLGAPAGFEAALAPLPKGARIQNRLENAGVVLAFFRSAAAVGRQLPLLAAEIRPGRAVWLLWPKKASEVPSDLTLPRLHEMLSPFGLTGYKSCAVDDTWSALAVAKRKGRRATTSIG